MYCGLYLDSIVMLFNDKGRKSQGFYYIGAYFQYEHSPEN